MEKRIPSLDEFINESSKPTKFLDINDKVLKDGDVIDIHQTVNGQNLFFIKKVNPLDVRYDHDRSRKYEYDKDDLLARDHFSGESTFEIVTK